MAVMRQQLHFWALVPLALPSELLGKTISWLFVQNIPILYL